jgi:VWFA-related protein
VNRTFVPSERLLTRRAWLAAAGLTGMFVARAQPPEPADDQPIFSSNVRVVSLLATVATKKGEIVRDLTKDDFTLLEDGRPQAIRYFSRETDLPLTLGLLIDTSMSQEKVLDKERGASFRFIDQVLRDTKDQFFILQFDMGVYVRQKLTASRKELDEALSYVDTPTRRELNMPSGAGTRLYDAVVVSCRDVMKDRHDRKAIIIMSDGVDTGSQATFAESLEIAQRSETLIYSIYFTDGGAYFGEAPDGRGILERLARETGGGFFEVTKKRSIEQIFATIQDELRSQYSLGFVSDVPVTVHGFRKLQLTAKTKGLQVQSRDRYWAAR